jgi:uncharacterized protein YjbI with pentapeptide repeats
MEDMTLEMLLEYKEARLDSNRDLVKHDNSYYISYLSGKMIKNMIFPDIGSLFDNYIYDSVFEHVIFISIDFSGVNLSETNFTKCQFIDCKFIDSSLFSSVFNECIFSECIFVKGSFLRSKIINTIMCKCQLKWTSFFHVVFKNFMFTENKIEIEVYWLEKTSEGVIWVDNHIFLTPPK